MQVGIQKIIRQNGRIVRFRLTHCDVKSHHALNEHIHVNQGPFASLMCELCIIGCERTISRNRSLAPRDFSSKMAGGANQHQYNNIIFA